MFGMNIETHGRTFAVETPDDLERAVAFPPGWCGSAGGFLLRKPGVSRAFKSSQYIDLGRESSFSRVTVCFTSRQEVNLMGLPEREVDQFARSVMNECDRDLVAAKKLAREKFASDEGLRGKFEEWCLLLVDEALDVVWRSYRIPRPPASSAMSRPAALLIAGSKAFNQMLLKERKAKG